MVDNRTEILTQKFLDAYGLSLDSHTFPPVMCYRADTRSPEEILSSGGFFPLKPTPQIYSSLVASAHNEGIVGFSVNPRVSALFARDEGYLYRLQITKGYIMAYFTLAEDEWKQEIAVPSLELDKNWEAYKVQKAKNGDLILVEMEACGTTTGGNLGQTTDNYRHLVDSGKVPHLHNIGISEDHPPVYRPERCEFYDKFIKPLCAKDYNTLQERLNPTRQIEIS